MVIRDVRRDDYQFIRDYGSTWWGSGGDGGMVFTKKRIFRRDRINLLLEDNGQMIGFLIGHLFFCSDGQLEGWISLICIRPGYRNCGLAQRLYEQFTQRVQEKGGRILRAVTFSSNVPSLAFHKKMGFTLKAEEGSEVAPGYKRVDMMKLINQFCSYNGSNGKPQ